MQKYPRTKAGMRKRRMAADVRQNKQFNKHNGEVHTKKWLEEQRTFGFRRARG